MPFGGRTCGGAAWLSPYRAEDVTRDASNGCPMIAHSTRITNLTATSSANCRATAGALARGRAQSRHRRGDGASAAADRTRACCRWSPSPIRPNSAVAHGALVPDGTPCGMRLSSRSSATGWRSPISRRRWGCRLRPGSSAPNWKPALSWRCARRFVRWKGLIPYRILSEVDVHKIRFALPLDIPQ